MATHFWRRWMEEYLNLIERLKWMTPRRNLAVNDLVLVVDPATPRGEWPIGRVEIRPALDGVARSGTATWSGQKWPEKDTICKYTVRPVVKLFLLEEAAPEGDSEKSKTVFRPAETGPAMWTTARASPASQPKRSARSGKERNPLEISVMFQTLTLYDLRISDLFCVI